MEGGSASFELEEEAKNFYSTRTFSTGSRLSGARSGQGSQSGKADDMFLLLPALTQEAGLPTRAEIPRIWDTVVPDIDGTYTDTVYSFSPQYGSEEPVSVAECHASTFGSIDRLEGTDMG